MINNNSGLNFSNLDGENNSISEELKPISLAELLAAHNHGDDEHHDEHEHDFAGSDSSAVSEQISVSAAVINSPTATIDVNYYGFSQEAKNAFEYAVTIWEGWIKSDVAIEVDAYWEDLSQYGSGVLGAASPYSFKSNFTGATQKNTSYAMSLANHLAGEDLNGGSAEIEAWFNSGFSNWYFGTDGEAQKGKFDFTTVVLHELGHGFGLTDFIDYNNGKGSYGNTIFESFIVNSNNQNLNTFTNNSQELGAQLTSNNLFFNGVNATAANDGKQVKLYAPSKWEYGSSVAHLDEKTYPKSDKDSLMTPYFKAGEAIHNPGAIALGVLEDLGWDINKVDIAPATPPTTPVETPSTQPSTIKIEESEVTSYAGQDKDSIFTISDNNQQIEIKQNGWKKLAFNYEVTDKTILEFEFQSDIRGEIQGIGFDTDDKLSNSEKKRIFQLEGTDKFGISDFKNKVTGQGWKTYQINVGEYFTDNFNYLTFVNDHDKGEQNAASKYRNIKLYEGDANKLCHTTTDENSNVLLTIKDSTNNYNLSSYGGTNQDKGSFTLSDDKTEVELKGNSWNKLDINNYNITNNTVLKFEFQSNAEAEIQGIGFDNDDVISNGDRRSHSAERTNLFQVSGTQDWGIELENSYTIGSGWQTYEVNVGDYIRGEFNYLTLVSDDDISNSTAQTQFRNISLSEMG